MAAKQPANVSDVKLLLYVVLTVAGSWGAVRQDVHAYIDTKMKEVSDDMVRKLGHQNAGQLSLLMDTIRNGQQQHQDTTRAQLEVVQEKVGQRPVSRTVIMPPDTAGMAAMERRMQAIEQGIEQVLDGMATSKAKRAHNASP